MKFDDILREFRRESFIQKDKVTRFERLMRLWLLYDTWYSNLTEVWKWENFPAREILEAKQHRRKYCGKSLRIYRQWQIRYRVDYGTLRRNPGQEIVNHQRPQ